MTVDSVVKLPSVVVGRQAGRTGRPRESGREQEGQISESKLPCSKGSPPDYQEKKEVSMKLGKLLWIMLPSEVPERRMLHKIIVSIKIKISSYFKGKM